MHAVEVGQLRPTFDDRSPPEVRRLAEDCWAQQAVDRPAFDSVIARLEAMRDSLPDQDDEERTVAGGWGDDAATADGGNAFGCTVNTGGATTGPVNDNTAVVVDKFHSTQHPRGPPSSGGGGTHT